VKRRRPVIMTPDHGLWKNTSDRRAVADDADGRESLWLRMKGRSASSKRDTTKTCDALDDIACCVLCDVFLLVITDSG
jgi:hypothetical protein